MVILLSAILTGEVEFVTICNNSLFKVITVKQKEHLSSFIRISGHFSDPYTNVLTSYLVLVESKHQSFQDEAQIWDKFSTGFFFQSGKSTKWRKYNYVELAFPLLYCFVFVFSSYFFFHKPKGRACLSAN